MICLLQRIRTNLPLVHYHISSSSSSSSFLLRSASLTLTYAYDDFILAQLSSLVGDTSSAEAATLRAQNYRNSWSAEKEFMCPRSKDGTFQCSKTATSADSWSNYVEGGAGLGLSGLGSSDDAGLCLCGPSEMQARSVEFDGRRRRTICAHDLFSLSDSVSL
jgi:hypothetical protein